MPKGYRSYLPDQDLLLPPNLHEWVAEEHLVYFVSDVVDQLDLSAIQVVYGEEKPRQPPYDRRLITKLLYRYCTGAFSSRRIQERLRETPSLRYSRATSPTSERFRTFVRSTRHAAGIVRAGFGDGGGGESGAGHRRRDEGES
jgi:transposase